MILITFSLWIFLTFLIPTQRYVALKTSLTVIVIERATKLFQSWRPDYWPIKPAYTSGFLRPLSQILIQVIQILIEVIPAHLCVSFWGPIPPIIPSTISRSSPETWTHCNELPSSPNTDVYLFNHPSSHFLICQLLQIMVLPFLISASTLLPNSCKQV